MIKNAGLVGRAAIGGGTGAAAGAITYADDTNERLVNAGMGLAGGAVFGALAEPVARGVGKVFAKGKSLIDGARQALQGNAKFEATITRGIGEAAERAGLSIDELGEAYTERVATEAAEALKNNIDFDYDAALRQVKAEKVGFEGDAGITRGQASRDPRVFSAEQNLSKRPQGAVLAERMNNQLAQAERVMDGLAKQPDLDPVDAGDAMRGLAKARADSMQAEVRAFYDDVPNTGDFSRDTLANRTAQIIADFRDDISSGVKQRIQELVDPNSNRAFSADELMGLDKLISETMPPNPTNAARGTAAGKLKDALLGVMEDAEKNAPNRLREAYTQAKNAAKRRFKAIGPHNGLVAQLVHGTIDPTQVTRKIAGGKIDDLKRLKEFMTSGEWETVQRTIENFIVEEARPGGEFGQAAYDRVIKKIGRARLKEIFGEEKAKDLFEFRDVARDLFRYPRFHTINTSNTAPEGANIVADLMGGVMDIAPGGRLAKGLLDVATKGRGAKQAEQETIRLVGGLLNPQPLPQPMPNPALPILPYLRGATPSVGLLGAHLANE
ncbi:MAG: hypothetical protein AAF387_15175, partial [Pseudomonadota bacterium]